MAARTRKIKHDERTKEKIRASQIINRLQKYIDTDFENDGAMAKPGGVRLMPGQVTAALGLLKKTVPDLQAVEHKGDGGGPVRIEIAGGDKELL